MVAALNGWVFDVAGEQGGMTVWFRAATGETVALFAPFRPSFVLAGNRLKEAALRAAAAATRELCGRGVDLRPGSKIRYLLADRGVRAMGFLDGTETPDVGRYEEMLRDAGDELMEIVACSR